MSTVSIVVVMVCDRNRSEYEFKQMLEIKLFFDIFRIFEIYFLYSHFILTIST